MNIIKGKLDPFAETGTEGVIWSIYEDGKTGYDGLHCLSCGDYLTVYDPTDLNKIVWSGNIDLEWERNYRPYASNPNAGQQEIAGVWVQGIQSDVEPANWAHWFFKQYPAELIKSGLGQFYKLKSSTLAACSYTSLTGPGDLIVKFKSGAYYRYKNVESSVFREFYNSESKGKFLARNIKNKYEYEQVVLPSTPVSQSPAESFDEFLEWTEGDEAEFFRLMNEDTDI